MRSDCGTQIIAVKTLKIPSNSPVVFNVPATPQSVTFRSVSSDEKRWVFIAHAGTAMSAVTRKLVIAII